MQAVCQDVRQIKISENSIVYIDPPYQNTTPYGYDFDVVDFATNLPNKCYVSEGKRLSSDCVMVVGESERKKGGINCKKAKKSNEEWLSVFH